MTSRITLVFAIVAALASAARADVNRFSTGGRYLDAAATTSEALAVKGAFNTKSDKVRGRVTCERGCPLRGRLRLSCKVGEGFYFVCQGKIGRKCQVEGTLYQHGFEGSYACRGRTGAWTFGNP